MGARNRKANLPSLTMDDVSIPTKGQGVAAGYIQRTHSDLRADPRYQRESEKFLTWLSENESVYEKITGGLVSSDIFETLRDEEGRLGTAVDRARIMRDAPEDIKETYKYLSEEFEASKAGNFGEILKATWDRGIDLIADPINLAFALVAPGIGSAATKASTAAAQKVLTSPGGKAAAQKTLRNIAAANTGTAAAFEGGAWTGIENFYRQDKNISLGIQDAFSKGDFALATGAGLAIGGGLGYSFGRVFSSTPSLIDNVNNSPKVAPKKKIDFNDPETPKPEQIEYRVIEDVEGVQTEVIKNVNIVWGTINDLKTKKPKVREDGTPVHATRRMEDGVMTIMIDEKGIRESFDSNPWTKSQVPGVTPLKKNDIKTEEEWIMFNLFHERNHASYFKPEGMPQAIYENGANVAALKDLKIWRETQRIEELVPFTFTAGTARDQQTGKFIKNKIDATLSNTFNKAKLSVNPTTGQSYYNRSLNPEVDTNLLNRIVTGLKDKDKNIIVMLPEADASNMILAIKNIITKQGDDGAEIGLNTIAPQIQTAVRDYNFNADQLKRLVDEISDTYFPAKKQIVGDTEGIFQPRLSDNDMRDLSNQLANDIGGSSKNTGSILYDKLNNINSNPNYNSLQVKDSMASAAYAQTQKYLGSSIGGFIKAANILNPSRRFAPNVMSFLQRSFNSEMNESWKTGSVVIRDTNDFSTYFNRRFGSWETPWKKAYDGIKQTAKGPQREKIDELISNAIRTGSKRGLNTVKFATPEAKKAVVESIDILQKNFADIGKEGSDKGLLRNLSANYLPRLWMRDKIVSNRESFIDLVVSKNGVKGINDRVEADNWIEELLDIKYQFGNENGFGGNSFFANRKLDIGDETIFNDFLDTDLDRVTKGYFSSAAKAFAKKDILGVRNAEEFDRLWLPAIEKEMKLNGANGAQILGGKKNASYLYKNITGEGLERFGPKTQFGADAYMLANQMAYLPLGTLSSITEIFLNMSKAGIGTSMRGFRDATMSGSKKIYDDSMGVLAKVHGMTSAESKYEMKMMGIAMDQAAADEMQRIAGNELSNATMRKISNRFFKLNLLDQWTRFVQLTSYITGKRVITETIETLASKAALINKGQISKRTQIEIDQLASLGIDYKDGIKWYNEGAKLEDAFYTKIKQGGGTYTDGVILTPSSKSGLKPAYMNHPQTAILGQLLGYPAAFSNVVLKGMFKQIARDPRSLLTHHIPAVAMMTGVAALANGVRTNGEAWEDKESFEIARDAIFRWGGNGLLIDMFSRGRDSAKYYQNLSGYVAGTGVVQGDVFNLITQGNPFSWFVSKAPGTGLFKALFEPFEATEDFPENIREFGEAGDDLLKDLFIPERDRNAKGGLVDNVVQVAEEPDERIDRMTGFPYNIQAGGAFIDEEDRQEFKKGGKVLNSLHKNCA